MKKIERLDTEVKIGKIIKTDEGFIIEDYDKDDNLLDTFTIDELLRPYVDKEYVQFVVKYSKEI